MKEEMREKTWRALEKISADPETMMSLLTCNLRMECKVVEEKSRDLSPKEKIKKRILEGMDSIPPEKLFA
ncbi:MAG: hypothetical protein U9R14_02375 [Patescibacteria group bacterium]|nr:hypothetical protein [Patescibacteria group bacterium]